MNWDEWYKHYDTQPHLQARLRLVRTLLEESITARDLDVRNATQSSPARLEEAFNSRLEAGSSPRSGAGSSARVEESFSEWLVKDRITNGTNFPKKIQIISICSGDARDLIGALQHHPRCNDVSALLIDNNAESIARGRAAAEVAGLGGQCKFLEADATLVKNYRDAAPADVVLLSGLLGHLRHADVAGLIGSLPMLCKTGGRVIWNRHLRLHDGDEQVPAIRELFRQSNFKEEKFEMTGADGFAVGCMRFTGEPLALEDTRVLFEFVGLDRLLSEKAQIKESAAIADLNVAATGDGRTPGSGTRNSDPGICVEAETTIPARFAEIVARHPNRTALGGGKWQPTYAELNLTANRLAHAIMARGGEAQDRIAILMRHDTPLSAAVVAILKAGRIVVVLNPSDPQPRLAQILADAEPALIITDEDNRALAERVAEKKCGVLSFEDARTGPAPELEFKASPHDVAWLIYTSGSTGQPKGVIQTHRNIAHNVIRLSRGMELRPEDRIILLASPSGGQGVATTWCALLNGASLFPFSILDQGASSLKEWMKQREISVWVASSSIFRHFVKMLEPGDHFPCVRLVRFGSEAATAGDYAAWQRYFPERCVIMNSLSASETGNVTQHHLKQKQQVARGRLPVGRTNSNVEILLLDENGAEIQNGDVGEIVIRGRYLSPGYWRNEALTTSRFSGDGSAGGIREFRSGDLGRWLADGVLMFMDRKDARVKIHGYRVELSEIEDALTALPEADGALVSARDNVEGEKQLVAHVVVLPGRNCTAEQLRRKLRETLPGYMVPAHFVFLSKFPLTPHGKIDRAALPPPPENKKTMRRGERPRDVVESRLARIWEATLGVSPIGRRDDFFDLGGSSLQSVDVLLRIEEAFEVSLPPSTLAEHSTVERLAALLVDHAIIPSASPLVPLRTEGNGRPLFLIHSGQGDVTTYGPLARQLSDRPVYGLQSVGLHGECWPLTSVPAMAKRYLPEIIAKDPTGPYLIGATCMGGLVAFEIARLLMEQGRQVALLALMDVPHPRRSWQHPKLAERLYGPMRDPVRDAFRMLRWRLVRAAGSGRSDRFLPAYRRFVSHMNSRANRWYTPGFYPGEITLFLTAETEYAEGDRRLKMKPHAKATRTIVIPGKRSGLFVRPGVDELAEQLQRCCEEAEKERETLQSVIA